MILTGSVCLTNIPREQVKKVMCKDGIERLYLNIAIVERKEKSEFGHTHFISCAPKKEERKEGVNYIIGDLKVLEPKNVVPTEEEVNYAPSANSDDLPF